jgi:hypothetical protein
MGIFSLGNLVHVRFLCFQINLGDFLNLKFCKAYIWIVFHEKTNCVTEVLTTLSIGKKCFFLNNIEISAIVVYF